MAISVVQSNNNIGASGAAVTSLAVGLPNPPTPGNAIVVPISLRNTGSGASVSSVTDFAGNSYTQVVNKASAGAHPNSSSQYWCQSIGSLVSFTLGTVAITGTGGQFSCAASTYTLYVGMVLKISGTYGGTGSINSYVNPTSYIISATNGSTTFTIQTLAGGAVGGTAGTPTGLTYTVVLSPLVTAGQNVCLVAGALEVSGLSAVDVTTTKNDGGTQVLTTGTVTAGGADAGNDLVVAICSGESNPSGVSMTDPANNPTGGAYTSVYFVNNAFPFIGTCESSYRINASTLTDTVGWTWITNSDNYSVAMASYKGGVQSVVTPSGPMPRQIYIMP